MRALTIALLALVAGGLGYGFWRYSKGDLPFLPRPVLQLPGPAPAPSPMSLADARKVVVAKFRSDADYAVFFQKLEDNFPADYDEIVDKFAAQVAAGGDGQDLDFYLSEAYRALRQTRGVVAAKASAGALAHVFETRAAVLEALGEANPHLCVEFLHGGVTQAYFEFSQKHRALVGAMALAGLDAVLDGEAKNVVRPRPSDADFDALEQALAAQGLSKAEIATLIDGKSPDPPVDDARLCTVGVANLQALRGMPEEPRLRIYGLTIEMMARS